MLLQRGKTIERVKSAIKAVKRSSDFERDCARLFLGVVKWYYTKDAGFQLPQDYVRFIEYGELSEDKIIAEIAGMSICDEVRILADVVSDHEFAKFNGSRSGLEREYKLICKEMRI